MITDILRIWNTAFAVLLPYLQECSYLHYHSVNDYQTWHGDNLPWVATTNKVTRFFRLMVFWDSMTNQQRNISTIAMLKVNKSAKVLTIHDSSVTSHLTSHDKLNTLSSHLHQTDDHQILQDKNLPWGTSTQKFT